MANLRLTDVVIRPRATGVRLALLRQEASRPLAIVSVLILLAGTVRAIADQSSIRGTITLIWLPVLALATLAYMRLYYRNVSWGVIDGELVHTGTLFQKKRIPIATIRKFVAVTITSDRINSSLVLILGDEDRYLAQLTGSEQYMRSDLQAVARAAQVPIVDGATLPLTEFMRRYPRAVFPLTSVAIALQARGQIASWFLAGLIVAVFLVYEILTLPWH